MDVNDLMNVEKIDEKGKIMENPVPEQKNLMGNGINQQNQILNKNQMLNPNQNKVEEQKDKKQNLIQNEVEEQLNLNQNFVQNPVAEHQIQNNLQLDLEARFKSQQKLQTELNAAQRCSDEMNAVKQAVKDLSLQAELERKIDNDNDIASMKEALDTMEQKYIDTIEKCSVYLKKKEGQFFRYDERRYATVKNTREMLETELGLLHTVRRSIEKNPDQYKGNSVRFSKIINELHSKEKDPITHFGLKHFVRAASDMDCKYLVYRNNRLYRLDSGSREYAKFLVATRDNYVMLRHFISLLLEKQNFSNETTKKKIIQNMLLRLGADIENKLSKPVNLEDVRQLLKETSPKVSAIDGVLNDNKTKGAERHIAEQIDGLLGKAYSKTQNKRELRSQILSILREGNKSQNKIWKPAGITEKDMEDLINGAVEVVRDRAFECAMKIYSDKKRLHQNQKNATDYMKDEDMKLLMGLVISETIKESGADRDLYSICIQKFEEAHALDGREGLKNDLNAVRIEEFNCFDASVLRNYFLDNPDMLKKLGQQDKQKKTLHAISVITDNMQEIFRIESKGLSQGLNEEDAKILESRAQEIDDLYQDHSVLLNNFKDIFSKNSSIARALTKLGQVYQNQQTLHQTAVNIATALKTDQPYVAEKKAEKEANEVISEYFAAKAVTDTFSKKAREVASIFLGDKQPDYLIDKQKSARDKLQRSNELIDLHNVLRSLEETKGQKTEQVYINGIALIFTKDRDGILTMKSGNKKVALPYNAGYWADTIAGDVFSNFNKYDPEEAKGLIINVMIRDLEQSTEKRSYYENFLLNHIGVLPEELNNLTLFQLRTYVKEYCLNAINETDLKNAIETANAAALNKTHINSQAALEGLKALTQTEQQPVDGEKEKKKKNVVFADNQEDAGEELKQMLNFVGDIFFTGDTKDGKFEYNADRLKKAILKNTKSFLLMISDDSILEDLKKKCEKIPCVTAALQAVEKMLGDVKNSFGKELWNIAQLRDNQANDDQIVNAVKEMVKKPQMDKVLQQSSDSIKNAVINISDQMQTLLSKLSNELSEENEDDRWKGLESLTISELIEKGVTGKKGEGAFNREVLSNYVLQSSEADKQNMVATTLKNLSKISSNDNVDAIYGKFIAGYIKGAGPLLHKMLQGMPISSMPQVLQYAVKDVRSSLNEIDQDIVDGQLNQIVEDSGNTIDHIEKGKVLGAASVGQTILVKFFEPDAAQGVDKVVKLLRPDVQNRIKREIVIMETCAKNVDAHAYKESHNNQPAPADYEGGMTKVYRSRLKNIKEELDLRTEADNLEKGKVYEDNLLHIRSMKADPKVRKSTNILVLEKAPGLSVDKFMEKKDAERKKITESNKKAKSTYDTLKKLNELRNDLKKKQGYLINMTRKWIEEALMTKEGFFHGDLHAGNAMIDDDGITIIDYGNVNHLTEDDQEHIMNLILSAARMNTGHFTNHLRDMLDNNNRDLYDAQQPTLNDNLKMIVKKETDNPVKKVLVALNELQDKGIEIPSSINSFIHCFVRLSGTLSDYDCLIDKVGQDMADLMEDERRDSIEVKPDSAVMPGIMRNILYRNESKYKDTGDTETLEQCIRNAVDSSKVDLSAVEFFCKEKKEDKLVDRTDLGRIQEIILDEPFRKFRLKGRFFAGGYNTIGRHLYKIRYDSKLNSTQIRDSMQGLLSTYSGVLCNLRDMDNKSFNTSIDRFTKDIEKLRSQIAGLRDKLQNYDNNSNDYAKLLRQINSLESKIEENEIEIQRYKKLIKANNQAVAELSFTLDSVKGKWDIDSNEKERWTREQAVKDIDLILEALKPALYGEFTDKDEQTFISALADLSKICINEQDDEDDRGMVNIVEDNVLYTQKPNEIVISKPSINLSLDDQIKQQREFSQAKEKLREAAQTIYDKKRPMTYRETLIEAILDEEKFKKLEIAFKDWYEGDKGDKLKKAYKALDDARKSGQQLNKNHSLVTTLAESFVKCIAARAERIERLIKNKNARDDSTDMNAVLHNLMRDHWWIALNKTDWFVRNRPMTPQYRVHLKELSKDKHTHTVTNLYNSLEKSRLPQKIEQLEKTAAEYKKVYDGATDQEKLKEAEKAYNNAVNAVMNALCNLNYSDTGKKYLESLLTAYDKNPTRKNFSEILSGINNYIVQRFEDTDYSDKEANGNNNQKSRFELNYSEKLGRYFMVPEIEHLKFGKPEQVIHNNEGKPLSLFERIKNGEAITWVSSSKKVVKQQKEVQVQENPVQEVPNYTMVAADINTSSNQSDQNKIWDEVLIGNDIQEKEVIKKEEPKRKESHILF